MISGEAKHHAKRRELTADEEAAAVAALPELAGGWADLRAEVCGVMEGVSEGELHEPLARQAAELCRKAGAGPEAIPRWIAEGRKRRDAAVLWRPARRRSAAPRRSCGRYTVSGGCASVSSLEEPAGRVLPGAGDLMARREITEAEQQRLDRYKQRRDEYLRKLAHLAPPLSEGAEGETRRSARPPRRRSTGAGRRLDVWASGRRLGRRPERNYVPGMAQTCVTGSGKIRMAVGASDDLARAAGRFV